MAPANPHIINQLRQLIYYHLDCNLLRNALFLAGRLHAYEPRCSEAAYLQGLCHLRLGQLKAAYDISKISGSRGNHLGCSYVFAQACLGLEKHLEGITATERCKNNWITRNNWSKHLTACSIEEAQIGVLTLQMNRQAHRNAPAADTRRCSLLLPTRQAMACPPRCK